MTSETTAQEFRTQLLNGWLGSLALHALVFLGALSFFHILPLTVPTDPFHWDVTLVQSTPTAHESVRTTDVGQPTVPKQPDRTATVAHTNRTIRHTTPSAQSITSPVPAIETPVTPTSTPDIPSSPVTAQHETTTTTIPHDSPPTLSQMPEPPRQQAETPIGSTTQEPPVMETVVARTNEPSSSTTEPAAPSQLPTTTTATDPASIPRPDYGWLQQAIFRRLEELKRSSRPSLDDSRPIKVTVKAVVSREGILLDSAVVKSSGLDRIDQEAMALVQRAFPMQLDRPLDRQQVAMRIPITYSRE